MLDANFACIVLVEAVLQMILILKLCRVKIRVGWYLGLGGCRPSTSTGTGITSGFGCRIAAGRAGGGRGRD